ncbi:MAG: rod shape-determining protein MreD [Acidimicrobiales bacterium]
MTWRAAFRYAVLLVVTALVQVAILNGIVIGGAHPDGFLLVAIAAGLVAGAQRGAVLAFVAGLVADLFVVTPYGLSSLCLVLVSFCVGLAAGLPGARASAGFRVLVAVLASIGETLLFVVIETLLGEPHPGAHQVLIVCLVVAIANAIGVLLVCRAIEAALSPGSRARSDITSLAGGSASAGHREVSAR